MSARQPSAKLVSAVERNDWTHVSRLARVLSREILNEPLSAADWTVLHFAASADALDAIRALLAANVCPDARASAGSTALHLAAWHGSSSAVGVLLCAGSVHARTDSGRTALHFAARRGRAALVGRIVTAGADIDARDRHGRTALFFAAATGHSDTVRELLDSGCDAGIADMDGVTPVQAARVNGCEEVIEMLVGVSGNGEGNEMVAGDDRGSSVHGLEENDADVVSTVRSTAIEIVAAGSVPLASVGRQYSVGFEIIGRIASLYSVGVRSQAVEESRWAEMTSLSSAVSVCLVLVLLASALWMTRRVTPLQPI